jgi:glycosyltransferase involved in cell wall biosynthesis
VSTRVSVVVPAYNNAEYIERTVDSILAQTYTDLEVIIADHASTDDTWGVIQQYGSDSRVTLLTTEAGGGALRNWNRVSQAATAAYLKLVCGDDLLESTIVERQLEALEAHPSATLAASAREIIDVNDKAIIRARGLAGLKGLVPGRVALRRTVIKGSNIFGEPACVMMRREVLARVGWWDSTFPYLIDEMTYAKVLLEGDLVAVPEPLAGFRVSNSQWSVRLARSQAEQAAGFHRWLRAHDPSVLSEWDVLRGNAAAWTMAGLRRSAYVLLKSRMRGVEE